MNNNRRTYGEFSRFPPQPHQIFPPQPHPVNSGQENENFVYNQRDFPPLHRAQKEKKQMSSAVQQIQCCIDRLTKKEAQDMQQNPQPPNPTTWNHTNLPYPVYNQQPSNDAKNCINQHYLQ